jgi:S1-C subfamily serine protease
VTTLHSAARQAPLWVLAALLTACATATARVPKQADQPPLGAPAVYAVHVYDVAGWDGYGPEQDAQARLQRYGRGLGVAIAPHFLLTAAHVIAEGGRPHHAIVIDEIAPGASAAQQAHLLAVHDHLDLAILHCPQALGSWARLRPPSAADGQLWLPRLAARQDQHCLWYRHRLSTIVLDERYPSSWSALADDHAYPGMSGGPACAADGAVVGIASSIGPFITQDGRDWQSTRFVGQEIGFSASGALLLHGPGWRYP